MRKPKPSATLGVQGGPTYRMYRPGKGWQVAQAISTPPNIAMGLVLLSVFGLVVAGLPWVMWFAGMPMRTRTHGSFVELVVVALCGLLYVCGYAISASLEIRSLKTRLYMATGQRP